MTLVPKKAMAQKTESNGEIKLSPPADADTPGRASLPLHPGVFGPAIADQFAALIVRHWRELIRSGEFNAACDLDIIDLCPGDGASGSMLCAAIVRRTKGMPPLRFRYLPVVPAADINPPVMRTLSEPPGIVCKLHWNIADPAGQPHLSSDDEVYRPGNAVVLLAQDAWSQLPQELYAVHYGKLLRANTALIEASEHKSPEQQLWSDADPLAWGERLTPLVDHYLRELNSSPVAFSAIAIDVLSKTLELSGRNAFIVSIGDGHSREKRLRLNSFAQVIDSYRKSRKLPVNFQLIAEWMRTNGGEVVDVAISTSINLQLTLISPSATKERLQSISRCIDTALFSSSHHLIEACKSLGTSVSLETRLNLLQMSRHDPRVFAVADVQIVQGLRKNVLIDRDAWSSALMQVWQNHRMYPTDQSLHRRIATVAMHCNLWGLARKILRVGLQTVGENAEDLANFAWCQARTGQLREAKSLVARALALDSSSELALEIDRRLSHRLAARDHQWLVDLHHESLPIILEPLDDSHAEAYCRQYRDPQIAVMTGLPALTSPDEVRHWIRSQQDEEGRVNFAVMHADDGFVGFINLSVSAHAAFFCFWTGIDFQGSGFATAAGRLVCTYAAKIGVPVMLTSAYKDNHRSIRALERIGFVRMNIRAYPPDHDRIFFSLIDSDSGPVDSAIELVNYYAREKLPMEFEGYTKPVFEQAVHDSRETP